jgi:hypothetical protein
MLQLSCEGDNEYLELVFVHCTSKTLELTWKGDWPVLVCVLYLERARGQLQEGSRSTGGCQ